MLGLGVFRLPYSRLTALIFVGLLVSAFVASSEPARAHFQSGEWSHVNSACNYATTREDPVSIIFYGWGYADRSVNTVMYHFGRGGGDLGQYFASHGNCEPTSHAAQGAGPLSGQYHIRIKKTTDGDPGGWEITSASTPHRERDCHWWGGGHGVYPNGFVEAAEDIIDGLWWRQDHGWAGYQNWGNTQLRAPECDGDWWATFDGVVGFVYQHYSFH